MQDMGMQQQAVHQQQLDAARQKTDALRGAYEKLRDAIMGIHTALSPHNLRLALVATATEGLQCFSLGAQEYEQLSQRLLGDWQVSEEDGERIVKRLRELLGMVSGLAPFAWACWHCVIRLPDR